jgi:hypothetical protein
VCDWVKKLDFFFLKKLNSHTHFHFKMDFFFHSQPPAIHEPPPEAERVPSSPADPEPSAGGDAGEESGLADDLETDLDDGLSDVALAFMSPLISDALLHRTAVRRWRHSPLATPDPPTTVLDFPFLLDVVAKTRVLRLLSFIAMVKRIEALTAAHRLLSLSSRLVPLQRCVLGQTWCKPLYVDIFYFLKYPTN